MKHCAFLSMDSLEGYVCDDELAIPYLQDLAWTVETISWSAASVDWSRFDVVVIRSPWDYQNRLTDFLAVLAQIEATGAVLANASSVVHWNIEKTYLRELADKGVEVVPTQWGKAAQQLPTADMFPALGADELVLKRVVGAGGFDAYRLHREDEIDWPAIQAVYADKDWMVQPFLDSVLTEGEYSLFYFAGRYSHAIVKRPQQGEYRVQEEHGGAISRIEPNRELQAAAESALAVVNEDLLYARVDLVRGLNGRLQLMELELIEPALYFRMDEAAPGNFARALDGWWATRVPPA